MINFFKKVVGKDNVRGAYRCLRHFTITRRCVGRIGEMSINNFPCHPELVSGSCHRQKCVTICTVSGKEVLDKVGWAFSPTMKLCWGRNPNLQNVISSTSRTATHHVRGELVPAFTLAEFFSPYYLSPRQIAFTLAEVFSPYYNSPRKVAFTLAEVLITLGIIGVVAAMTLPSIINNIQKKDTSARLKKFYSAFNQAILLSTVKNGPVSGWDNQIRYHNSEDLYNWFDKYLAPYIVKLKDCRTGGANCIGEYKVCNPVKGTCSSYDSEANSRILYVFADGSSISGYTGGSFVEGGLTSGGIAFEIGYDTNGFNKPNTIGKDIFYFVFHVNQEDENYISCTGCINGCKDGKVSTRSPRHELLDACKKEPGSCSCLLMADGWEFKDDYPW